MKKTYNRLSFIMDRELHKDFLMKCIKNDKKMTEVIKKLVEGYVEAENHAPHAGITIENLTSVVSDLNPIVSKAIPRNSK